MTFQSLKFQTPNVDHSKHSIYIVWYYLDPVDGILLKEVVLNVDLPEILL